MPTISQPRLRDVVLVSVQRLQQQVRRGLDPEDAPRPQAESLQREGMRTHGIQKAVHKLRRQPGLRGKEMRGVGKEMRGVGWVRRCVWWGG